MFTSLLGQTRFQFFKGRGYVHVPRSHVHASTDGQWKRWKRGSVGSVEALTNECRYLPDHVFVLSRGHIGILFMNECRYLPDHVFVFNKYNEYKWFALLLYLTLYFLTLSCVCLLFTSCVIIRERSNIR